MIRYQWKHPVHGGLRCTQDVAISSGDPLLRRVFAAMSQRGFLSGIDPEAATVAAREWCSRRPGGRACMTWHGMAWTRILRCSGRDQEKVVSIASLAMVNLPGVPGSSSIQPTRHSM